MKPRWVRFCIHKCTKTWFRVYLPLNATSFWKFVAGRKLKVWSFLQNWLWTTSKLDLHTRLLIISRVEIWPPIFSSPWTLYIMSYMSYVVSELACIRIMRQQFKFFLTFCLQYFACWGKGKYNWDSKNVKCLILGTAL